MSWKPRCDRCNDDNWIVQVGPSTSVLFRDKQGNSRGIGTGSIVTMALLKYIWIHVYKGSYVGTDPYLKWRWSEPDPRFVVDFYT